MTGNDIFAVHTRLLLKTFLLALDAVAVVEKNKKRNEVLYFSSYPSTISKCCFALCVRGRVLVLIVMQHKVAL